MILAVVCVWVYLSAGFESGVEDGFSVFVHEEGVHSSPLMMAEEVVNLIQCGIYTSYSYGSTDHKENI